jgi:hypothetical protein
MLPTSKCFVPSGRSAGAARQFWKIHDACSDKKTALYIVPPCEPIAPRATAVPATSTRCSGGQRGTSTARTGGSHIPDLSTEYMSLIVWITRLYGRVICTTVPVMPEDSSSSSLTTNSALSSDPVITVLSSLPSASSATLRHSTRRPRTPEIVRPLPFRGAA